MLKPARTEINYVRKIAETLWPICRSICGAGLRESLRIVDNEIGLKLIKYPTGTEVFDWEIPREWHVNEAYIETLAGKKVVDFLENNLHLVNYSIPFRGVLPYSELRKRLHTIPSIPDAIPYKTSYYREDWGFCVSHDQLKKFSESNYRVVVDTQHSDGFMEVGEHSISGKSEKEFLIWTHFCHPSMANDQLSGPLTLILFAKKIIARKKLPLSIKLCFAPETIGSVAYLAQNHVQLKKNIIAGLTCVLTGGDGPLSYRKTRSGGELIDEVIDEFLFETKCNYEVTEFNPAYGNDQRQFCSPGINLPVGSLSFTRNAKTPEYHTSIDNIDRLNFENIVNASNVLVDLYDRICDANVFVRKESRGELFLSKHNLYPSGNDSDSISEELREALLWLLNLSDGKCSLKKIIEISDCQPKVLNEAARLCLEKGLIHRIVD